MGKLFGLMMLVLLCASEAYKILVVFPVPGKSHSILGDGFIKHLLNAGHEVTGIVAFPKKSHPNFTEVVAESNSNIFNENYIKIEAIMNKELQLSDFYSSLHLMHNLSKSTILDSNVQKLLRDPQQKFDVVIAEWLLAATYSMLSTLYDCPLIWFSTIEPHWQVLRLIDENMSPAYNSDFFSGDLPPFSFSVRVEQLWIQIKGIYFLRLFAILEEQLYLNEIAPILREKGKSVPLYNDVMYNASLMLGNSHVSLGLGPTLPQSYKPIGGYHIGDNVSLLPLDLKNILDSSKHGFIYFSLGSNLKSKDIPQNLKDGFLKIFSKLKKTVIWKFEEVLPSLPKNVHILKWAPQQSILAHPNCVLFITHGGLLSITETLHFGIPIIGIPVFGDQFGNVEKAVRKGFGRKVDLSYTMDKELEVEIHEILGNPKYAQKAKEWSFIYHDRQSKPAQELVFWVEHVIKTRGAIHLRSPALLVPWYQKLYLDLLALIFIALIAVTAILKTVSKRIISAFEIKEKRKRL